MSLTSYRAAPPRDRMTDVRDQRSEGVLSSDTCHLNTGYLVFSGPGGDLLFRVLRRSTIGAEGFHGRVRDGIGCLSPRHDHQAEERPGSRKLSAVSCQPSDEDQGRVSSAGLVAACDGFAVAESCWLTADGCNQADRAISTGWRERCRSCTSGLST